ncbi:MAG: hypothetical protein IT373_02070 [Polyangiaceae bacterium]|nr:hypothetical protein [Polyangiaceae bacterium]
MRGVILLAFALATGGVSPRITRSPSAPPGPPATIAVLAFTSTDAQGASAADGCTEAVLEAGVRVVERQRVDAVLAEHTESRSGEMSAESYQELGRLLGADAFIVGSYDGAGFLDPGNLAVRLVQASTGDVVIMGSRPASGNAINDGRATCADLLRALAGR